jgi:V/A-type H+-transporting ATPase subunit I
MRRLSAVVLERDSRAVLRLLGRLGVMHLLKTEAGPDTAPLSAPDRTADLARAEAILGRIGSLRERLGLEPAGGTAAETSEISLDHAEGLLHPIEERANQLLSRRQEIEQRLDQVAELLDSVESYQSLDIPLDWIGESQFMHFAIGYLPAGRLEAVQASLAPNVVLMPMPLRHGHRPLVAITTHAAAADVDKVLKDAGFTPEIIPAKEGATTATLSDESREEQNWLRRELEQLSEQIRAEAAQVAQPLADLWNQVFIERRILEAEQNFPRTEQTSLVTGWVPAPDVPAVEQQLKQTTDGCYALTVTEPRGVAEAEIPVLLRHSWLLRPFEMLITMYGLPTYHEVEPTLFVAISYVLMFGMMFGDAGNGAVVALLGVGLLWKGRTQTLRDAGLLVLLAGLSSIGFGIYYGSYFGIVEIGGQALGKDPLAGNATTLMVAAIALGVGLMSLGLVLNIVNRLRRGDVMGALMDKFGVAGVVFYWGCLGLLGYAVLSQGGNVPWWLALAVILVPLAAVAAREPLHLILARRRQAHGAGHSNMGETLVESFVEAFETVLAFMANTISFVRLAAYAMSHAAVLMASFAIAEQIEKGVGGGLGLVLGVLVIVVGNVLAIALEGLVAFVQALRLEYYEFFGKFFSGAGQAFKPFRLPVKDQGMSAQG